MAPTSAVSTAEAGAAAVLAGERATGSSGALPERTCLRHLALLGAAVEGAAAGPAPGAEAGSVLVGADGAQTEAVISWVTGGALGEVGLQAVSGLMALHGRRAGRPRRLGVEVASVAAGVLAATGVLASRLARLRGGASRRVETSALGATMLFLVQHVAGATSGDDWSPPPPAPDPGPPFHSAEGHRFELETFDPEAWRDFWRRLGLEGQFVGTAWGMFFARLITAACSLPAGFHAATERCTMAQIRDAATAAGVSICRIRTAEEVLQELGGRNGGRGGRVGPPWQLRPHAADASPAPPAAPPAQLPLAGLRVVEVARRLQGPLASLLLQMLGAHVVRIEPPGGDVLRMMSPAAEGCSAWFTALNRGKEVAELDLKRPAGHEELLGLVTGADVFLHNMAPGKAEQLGLDSAILAACNPRLVYAHASGWGDALGSRPPLGTEYLVQAHSGLAAALEPAGDPPVPSLLTLADVAGALVSAEGMLAGLVLRQRTGQGCRVDSSLLSGAMALQTHVLDALGAGVEVGRRGGRPVWGPLDSPVETADGFLVVDAGDDEALRRLGEACGVDPGRLTRKEVEAAVAGRLGVRPAAEWEPLLAAAGVPCATVRLELARLPDDPLVAPTLERVGGCWVPRSPWQFS